MNWSHLVYELRHKTRYRRNNRKTDRSEGKTRRKKEAATEWP